MLFRDFSIIAAVAYAAQVAANATGDEPAWDDLAETERGELVERVLSIGRGDFGTGLPVVFASTVQAILGYNGGQGGLALERIADLGQFMVDSGLVSEEDAGKGGDIVDHAKALLSDSIDNGGLGQLPTGEDPTYVRSTAAHFAAQFNGDFTDNAGRVHAYVANPDGSLNHMLMQSLYIAHEKARRGPFEPELPVVIDEARKIADFLAADIAKPTAPEVEAEREDATVQ